MRAHHGVGIDFILNQALFFVAEPLCIGHTIVEAAIDDEAEHKRRQRFDDEQPLPPFETPRAVEGVHQIAGQRAAEQTGDRNARHQ